jgi:hypothetical protein
LVEDEHGEPLSVGRKTRVVPQAIKRALWARDGGCRFPGCGRRRFVDAHHIEHWSAGGETSLAFRIEKDYRDRWFFRRPDGRAVPACGYRTADMRDDSVAVEDEYFAVHQSVHTSAEASTVAEPSAEVYRVKRARRPSAEVLPFTFSSASSVRAPTAPQRPSGASPRCQPISCQGNRQRRGSSKRNRTANQR